MSTCRRCGAPLVWIRTTEGRWMPCDEGLTEYHVGSTPDFEDRIVTEDGRVLQCTFDFQCRPDGLGRIPHWATCPFADDFRTGRTISHR